MEVVNRFASDTECARFTEFLAWLSFRGRRDSTIRSYRSDWQDLTIWYRRHAGNPFESTDLDADLVAGWRQEAENKGRSPSTILRRLAFVRSYSGWLYSESLLDEVTLEAIRTEAKLRRAERGTQLLSPEEILTFISHVDQRGCLRDQAIVYMLLDSGLRISELVELDVGAVDFAKGELSVGSQRTRVVPLPTRAARKLAWSLGERGLLELPEAGEVVLPATGGWPPSELVAPPDAKLVPALRSVPLSPMPFGCSGSPANWPLFVGERGRLSINGVQRVVRKHATFARVDVTPQKLRHAFALAYWTRTQDLVGLAEVLGLESVESVKIYSQMAPAVELKALDNTTAFG